MTPQEEKSTVTFPTLEFITGFPTEVLVAGFVTFTEGNRILSSNSSPLSAGYKRELKSPKNSSNGTGSANPENIL